MRFIASLPDTQGRVLDALRERADGAATPAALELLTWSRGPSTTHRLQIYRNNLAESLIAALAAVYPVVTQLVGEDYFRQLARLHIARHPMRSGHLHPFGRELPALLREVPSAAELPYLADVAALEWAWHEVYHEADTLPLDPALLQEVPPKQQMNLGLQLAAAARLVSSPYPILRIWHAHQGEGDPAFEIALDEGGVDLLVLRRELEIEFVLLDAAEALWLRELQRGVPLALATQAALDTRLSFDLAATLGRHLALGTFAALSFATLPLSTQEVAS
jgi:hypothetical protein